MSVPVELLFPTGIFIPSKKGKTAGFVFGYVAQRYDIPEISPLSAPVAAQWQSYAEGRDFQEQVVVRADIATGKFYQRVGHRPVENDRFQIDDSTDQDFSLGRAWINMPPCAKDYGEDQRCIQAWNKFVSKPRELSPEDVALNSRDDLIASQAAYFQYHAQRFVVIGDFLYREEDEPRLVITRSPSTCIFPAVNGDDMDGAIEYLPLSALEVAHKRFTAFFPPETDPKHWPFECPRPDLMRGNFFRDRIELLVEQFLDQIDFETGGIQSPGYNEFCRKLDAGERQTLAALQTHTQTRTKDLEYDIGAGKALLLLEPTSALWSLTERHYALRALREILRTDLKIFEFSQASKEPLQRRLH